MKPYENLSLEDMEGEVWKDVVGGEGLYQVSNMGRIKRLARKGKGNSPVDKIMKQQKPKTPKLPLHLRLFINGRQKNVSTHRIVAQAFLPNPNNYTEIDHIDTNRYNNVVDNLRWCTKSMNMRNPITYKKVCVVRKKAWEDETFLEKERYNMPHSVPVIQYSLNGDFIAEYRTISEACRSVCGDASAIARCCRGKQKTSYGYIWKFKKINQN